MGVCCPRISGRLFGFEIQRPNGQREKDTDKQIEGGTDRNTEVIKDR